MFNDSKHIPYLSRFLCEAAGFSYQNIIVKPHLVFTCINCLTLLIKEKDVAVTLEEIIPYTLSQ